ncbi:MAG: hypothetical protein ACE5GQ_00085 [Nitrospinales bacterium]
MKNFGLLKLRLMQSGVYISPEALKAREVAGGFLPGQAKTEITLAFREDFFVRTFLNPDAKQSSRMEIRNGGILLFSGKEQVKVDIVPPPAFMGQPGIDWSPVTHNVDLDGNCLNVFLRAEKSGGFNMTPESVVSVIRAAFEEGVADLVQLNLDYFQEADRGFSRLAPLIKEIRKNFRTFISLRGFPPKSHDTIDAIYASGVDLLNYPLEGFARSETSVTPSKLIVDALEYAAGVFPQGAVATELSLGPARRLKEKIDLMAGKGIIPRVKLDTGKKERANPPSQAAEVARSLTHAAQRNKLNLKWLYPSSYFVTPLDASFFTEDPKSARLAVRPLYQSKLGRAASEGFAALRRKLRVRNISDSFESAGL